MASETGWLIEWQALDGARWLTLEKMADFRRIIFEKDATAALRFGRREDADAFIDLNRREVPAGVIATDHMWCDGPDLTARIADHTRAECRDIVRCIFHSQSDASAEVPK